MSDTCDARKCTREWEFDYKANGLKAHLCNEHWTEAANSKKEESWEWIKRRCVKRRERRE